LKELGHEGKALWKNSCVEGAGRGEKSITFPEAAWPKAKNRPPLTTSRWDRLGSPDRTGGKVVHLGGQIGHPEDFLRRLKRSKFERDGRNKRGEAIPNTVLGGGKPRMIRKKKPHY